MLDNILVLLDGSTLAQTVLPHVRTFARAFQADTTLLRVLELKEQDSHTQVDPVNWHLRKVEANSYLNGLLYDWPPSETPPKVVLDEGTAVDRIIAHVKTNEPDLVALSTHGQHGLSTSSISSVAQKIIYLIPTSFLLVRAHQAHKTREKASSLYQRIMLPLDGSRRAECVLPFATKLAATYEAELVLVHVIPQTEMIQRRPLSPEEAHMSKQLQERNEKEASNYLSQIATHAHKDVPIDTRLLKGTNVSDALIHFTKAEQIDLVIMCAHGQSGGNKRLHGSIVTNLINYGSTTLFVVQDLPSDQIKLSETDSKDTIATGDLNRKNAYAQPPNWNPD
jgi:nucleotide-binding universal stress UspA family protein